MHRLLRYFTTSLRELVPVSNIWNLDYSKFNMWHIDNRIKLWLIGNLKVVFYGGHLVVV